MQSQRCEEAAKVTLRRLGGVSRCPTLGIGSSGCQCFPALSLSSFGKPPRHLSVSRTLAVANRRQDTANCVKVLSRIRMVFEIWLLWTPYPHPSPLGPPSPRSIFPARPRVQQ
eukprot:74299-Amphidinium_carterae.1